MCVYVFFVCVIRVYDLKFRVFRILWIKIVGFQGGMGAEVQGFWVHGFRGAGRVGGHGGSNKGVKLGAGWEEDF